MIGEMEKSVKGRRGGGGKSGRGGGEGVPGQAAVLLVELLVVGPGLDSMPPRRRRLLITQRGRREEKGRRGRRGQRVSGCHAETLREKTQLDGREGRGGGGEGPGWLAEVAAFGPETPGSPHRSSRTQGSGVHPRRRRAAVGW